MEQGPSTGPVAVFGRDEELARLVDIADRAVESGTQMVLIAGEAGIGKTTLVTEMLNQLHDGGWGTHIGHCLEYADKPLPFAPIVAILRSLLLDNLDHVDELTAHHRQDLGGLLPELADVDGGVPLAAGVDRLFQAVTAAFVAATKHRPAAVLVEDIHWADAATRDLLAALVRSAGRARLLVIVTERSGAVARDHPLRTWLAEHRRLANVHAVELSGLTRDSLGSQAAELLGEEPDPALIDDLLERTQGNPYYAHELINAHRDGDNDLPTSLVEFLTSRINRLNDDERLVLRAIAIAGGSVSHPRLTAMLPDVAVGEQVRELFDRSILGVEGSDYVFGHALLRDAILRDVLPFEAEDLHRRAAEAILADPRPGSALSDLASVALHWDHANDADRSLAAAVTAAYASAGVAAHEAAADLSLQAYRAWFRAHDPEACTELTRFQLLVETVRWLSACWRGQEAVDLIDEALAGWGADLPTGEAALLSAKKASLYWNLGAPDMPAKMLAEARRLIGEERSAEAAEVHYLIAFQALGDAFLEVAHEEASLALAIAERHGPAEVHIEALGICGFATAIKGDLDGGLELLLDGRRRAVEAGLVHLVSRSFRREYLVLQYHRGRVPEVLTAIESGLEYNRQHCGPRLITDFQLDLVQHFAETGEFTKVPAILDELYRADADDLRRMTIFQNDAIYSLGIGDLDRARRALDDAQEIANRYDSSQETGYQLRMQAELARKENRLDDAIARIRRAVELQLASDNLTYTRESLVEIIRIAGECVRYRHPLADQLVKEAAAHVTAYGYPGLANEAYRAQMQLELNAIDGPVNPEQGLAAAGLLREAGFRFEAAKARLLVLESRLLNRNPDRDVLEQELAVLHELALTCGMTSTIQRVEAMAATARIPLPGAAVEKPSAIAAVPDLPHHLTDREVEVMALLAEGLTNKAIGERLFVSPRTVGTHVSNLLAKLGASTRGEAAAAFHRLGLGEIIDLREQADSRTTA